MIVISKYSANDLPDMIRIWNEVVEEGVAFPQEEMASMPSVPVWRIALLL